MISGQENFYLKGIFFNVYNLLKINFKFLQWIFSDVVTSEQSLRYWDSTYSVIYFVDNGNFLFGIDKEVSSEKSMNKFQAMIFNAKCFADALNWK